MNMESIKEKIRKLLALSDDNPSDAEGYEAFKKAQELMVQYKLEQKDISDNKEQECIRRKTVVKYGTRSSDHYINDLATVIAQNFCCINYISTPRGTQSHYICFMGLKDDVSIAEEILATAVSNVIRGYNRVYKDVCKFHGFDYLPAKYFNPIKTGYVDGYVSGLRDALEDQKAKNQEWGLVLVVPQEAQDFLSDLTKADFSLGGSNYMDDSYYEEGYNDGVNFQLNKKLEDQKKLDN